MGRIFEKRKATMFARWNRMAKAFTRMERNIVLAVKGGGPNPEANPALRRVIQNAKSVSMPKDKIESAIKRASGKDQRELDVLLYEGYAPHGIAMLVEAATDNRARTAPNVRSIFNKYRGNLAQSGSVSFLFKQMGVFRLTPEGFDHDEVELELIDHGLDEMGESTGEQGEKQIVLRCGFNDFGRLQHAIEERKLPLISAESEYVALNFTTLDEAQARDVLELVDAFEQDDDVQRVFHNLG